MTDIKLPDWEARQKLAVTLAGVFLVMLGVGVFLLKTGDFETNVAINNISQIPASDVNGVIWVDVEGAVNTPGVYKLNQGARVEDVIVAAGGLSSNVNLPWVEKNINRAQELTDGYKLYIPSLEENVNVSVRGVSTELISINNSPQKDLEILPGIGPVTAAKIISGRPYAALEELTEKKIIGSKVWEDIKDQIQLW